MAKKTCVTEEHIELELLRARNEVLEHADKRYAPLIVKTIVYSMIATFAGGIVLGVGSLVTTTFLEGFENKTYEQTSN